MKKNWERAWKNWRRNIHSDRFFNLNKFYYLTPLGLGMIGMFFPYLVEVEELWDNMEIDICLN